MDTVLRIGIIYLFVLFGMRIIGKREFGQLSPHEFVVLLMIPEIVSTTLNQNDRSITNGLLGVATILSLVFITSLLSHRFKPVQRIVTDSEAVLVHKGIIFEDVLNRERVTPDEILEEARKSGVESLDGIKWAVLEPDGQIAIVPIEQGGGNYRPREKAK
ncbi:MAG: YetF domain-containing protein [Fimbriimonadaceae bacterium]